MLTTAQSNMQISSTADDWKYTIVSQVLPFCKLIS